MLVCVCRFLGYKQILAHSYWCWWSNALKSSCWLCVVSNGQSQLHLSLSLSQCWSWGSLSQWWSSCSLSWHWSRGSLSQHWSCDSLSQWWSLSWCLSCWGGQDQSLDLHCNDEEKIDKYKHVHNIIAYCLFLSDTFLLSICPGRKWVTEPTKICSSCLFAWGENMSPQTIVKLISCLVPAKVFSCQFAWGENYHWVISHIRIWKLISL